MGHVVVQSDYKFKWYADRVNFPTSATYSSTSTAANTIEFAFLDTSTAGFNLTFPEVIDSLDITLDVVTTREFIIIGDATLGSNNVTLLPNGTGITLGNESSFVMDSSDQMTKWELIGTQWVLKGNSGASPLGSFYLKGNASITSISTINTYTDIAGTAVAPGQNSLFTFSTGPNALTSDAGNTYDAVAHVNGTVKRDIGASVREYALALFQDTGSGYAQVTGGESSAGTALFSRGISFGIPVTVAKDDKFKVMVENRSTTDDIIVDVDLEIVPIGRFR